MQEEATNDDSVALEPCSIANSIIEADLKIAVEQQTITELRIMEIRGGFYVTLKFKWSGNKIWYLSTRRDRATPRVFISLTRLNDFLRDSVPTGEVLLLRNQAMPPPGDA